MTPVDKRSFDPIRWKTCLFANILYEVLNAPARVRKNNCAHFISASSTVARYVKRTNAAIEINVLVLMKL